MAAASAVVSTQAQTDDERSEMAHSILSRTAEKNKSYSTISVAFAVKVDDLKNKAQVDQKGSLVMKGDKYVLDTFDAMTYFDGQTQAVWSYEANEVTLNDYTESTDETISPQKFFGSYETGYKLRCMDETKNNGVVCYEVELYPEARNTNIARIHLSIEKQSLRLKSIVQQSKDGMIYTIGVTSFEVNKSFDDSYFVFDAAAHPDVEVVDMR